MLGAVVCAALAVEHPRAESRYTEYQVKAAFLYNFAKFVEWPQEASQAQEPVVFAILGEDPFGQDLDGALRDKRINERPIQVRRVRRSRELDEAHLVFVSDSERGRIDGLLESLETRPVLTVGESERFASRGGMIEFFLHKNRVRFRINPQAAQRAGLKLSANLLRVAEIVGEPDAEVPAAPDSGESP